jgi:hypothetical protein
VTDLEKLALGENDHSQVSSNDSSGLSTPVTPSRNFSTDYYDHAQQALLLASLGGMYEAYRAQPQFAGALAEMESMEEKPPIGRSAFISLRVVTWEADQETVLEIGWSAIWWQEAIGQVKVDSENLEEMRDVGHIM